MSSISLRVVSLLLACVFCFTGCLSSESATALYKKLMTNYNLLIRPVANNSEKVIVYLDLALSQLVDIDEKNQIMITSVWLKQKWKDYKLTWNPVDYQGIHIMHIPIDKLWVPDIVLYNTAEGSYAVNVVNSAHVKYDGTVYWNPPAIFRSSCGIDISYFPFDEQNCRMKFGTWTYDGELVDLQAVSERVERENYRANSEWDIVETPVKRHTIKYLCCDEVYVDITYYFVLHRNPLFYVITLVIPCVLISAMTVLVFNLPSDAQEKITLSISVLLALVVFLLLIPDLMPPTSQTIPLIGQYMLFTMGMCSVSIVATVVSINLHFRTLCTHDMSGWVRTVFLEKLPWWLGMERPDGIRGKKHKHMHMEKQMQEHISPYGSYPVLASVHSNQDNQIHTGIEDNNGSSTQPSPMEKTEVLDSEVKENLNSCNAIRKRPARKEWCGILHELKYIQDNLQFEDEVDQSAEDWKYVGLVVDRLLMLIFLFVAIFGSVAIFLPAPVFWEVPGQHNTPVYDEPLLLESLTYNQYYNITE